MKTRVRVVFAINNLAIGGAERLTVEIIKRFNSERFECILVTSFTQEGESFLNDLPSHVAVHQLRFAGFSDISSWIKLYRLLKSLRPDVVVSNLFFSNTLFRVLKPFVGYKVITCEHNTYVDKSKAHQMVDRILSHYSYRIVAVSKTVAEFTLKQEDITKEKFVVITNGIDIGAWQKKFEKLSSKEVLRQELGFREDDKVILTVARLVPQKNQKLLLEGFAEFHKQYPKSTLAIVGDGFLRDTLQKQVNELGIKEAVIFFGARRDVEKFYKASDIFVLTSDIEGFGLVCIEAMCAGLPVVSTVTAGPDEYIKDGVNGVLIQDRSASAVADGIRKVIEGDTSGLRKGALETAQKYDIATSIELYEQLLEESLRNQT